jgi:hypothetical protein
MPDDESILFSSGNDLAVMQQRRDIPLRIASRGFLDALVA